MTMEDTYDSIVRVPVPHAVCSVTRPMCFQFTFDQCGLDAYAH